MHVKVVVVVVLKLGAFGKEAYLLTGYLNVPKVLEVTLNNGIDPIRRKSSRNSNRRSFVISKILKKYMNAFLKQLNFVVDQKIRVSNYIDHDVCKICAGTFSFSSY